MHCADTSVKTWVSMKDSLRFAARYRSGLDTYEETQNTFDGQKNAAWDVSVELRCRVAVTDSLAFLACCIC